MTTVNGLLARLFRAHHADLVRFASRLVGNRDYGEEVAQEAYLRIAARGTTIAIDHPKTYLFSAARHTAIDLAVKLRLEAARHASLSDALEVLDSADETERHHRRKRLAQITIALNELPPACRQAFVLNKFHGLTHKDIARRLGVSVSMVEKHMMRALSHCRDTVRENDVF